MSYASILDIATVWTLRHVESLSSTCIGVRMTTNVPTAPQPSPVALCQSMFSSVPQGHQIFALRRLVFQHRSAHRHQSSHMTASKTIVTPFLVSHIRRAPQDLDQSYVLTSTHVTPIPVHLHRSVSVELEGRISVKPLLLIHASPRPVNLGRPVSRLGMAQATNVTPVHILHVARMSSVWMLTLLACVYTTTAFITRVRMQARALP